MGWHGRSLQTGGSKAPCLSRCLYPKRRAPERRAHGECPTRLPRRPAGYRILAPPPGVRLAQETADVQQGRPTARWPISERAAGPRPSGCGCSWRSSAGTAIVGSALMFAPKWRVSAAIQQTGQLVVRVTASRRRRDRRRTAARCDAAFTLSLTPGPHALQLNRAEISAAFP